MKPHNSSLTLFYNLLTSLSFYIGHGSSVLIQNEKKIKHTTFQPVCFTGLSSFIWDVFIRALFVLGMVYHKPISFNHFLSRGDIIYPLNFGLISYFFCGYFISVQKYLFATTPFKFFKLWDFRNCSLGYDFSTPETVRYSFVSISRGAAPRTFWDRRDGLQLYHPILQPFTTCTYWEFKMRCWGTETLILIDFNSIRWSSHIWYSVEWAMTDTSEDTDSSASRAALCASQACGQCLLTECEYSQLCKREHGEHRSWGATASAENRRLTLTSTVANI